MFLSLDLTDACYSWKADSKSGIADSSIRILVQGEEYGF